MLASVSGNALLFNTLLLIFKIVCFFLSINIFLSWIIREIVDHSAFVVKFGQFKAFCFVEQTPPIYLYSNYVLGPHKKTLSDMFLTIENWLIT